jgi:hypothetical protein
MQPQRSPWAELAIDLAGLIGISCTLWGLALLSWPVALIVAGLALCVLAYFGATALEQGKQVKPPIAGQQQDQGGV